jgi:hypothetical protein
MKISLTTLQGYLSMAATFALALGPILAMYGHPKAAMTSGLVAAIIGAAKAAVGQNQQDATKPVDSQGKPVPSSEVPVKQ